MTHGEKGGRDVEVRCGVGDRPETLAGAETRECHGMFVDASGNWGRLKYRGGLSRRLLIVC